MAHFTRLLLAQIPSIAMYPFASHFMCTFDTHSYYLSAQNWMVYGGYGHGHSSLVVI